MQRVEARNRALLDAIPDLMFRVGRDGTYLDVHADDDAGLLLSPEELLGSNVRDILPAPVADALLACVAHALETGAMSSVEYELEIDGVERCFESRMVPSGQDEVVTIVRDFTEQRRAEAGRRRLGVEQAALRRVATLVAGDAPPEVVFQTVTEEACELIGIRTAVLHRYEDSRTSTIVGHFGEPTGAFYPGSTIPLEAGAAFDVLQTGRARARELRGARRPVGRRSCARSVSSAASASRSSSGA